jgi:hypothetical protein
MGSSSAHRARRRIRRDGRDALACEFVEAQSGINVNGILAREGLPALDGDVDKARLDKSPTVRRVPDSSPLRFNCRNCGAKCQVVRSKCRRRPPIVK